VSKTLKDVFQNFNNNKIVKTDYLPQKRPRIKPVRVKFMFMFYIRIY